MGLQEQLNSRGVAVVLVHPATEQEGQPFLNQFPGLRQWEFLADPEGVLYGEFGLGRMSWMQVAGPAVWARGALTLLGGTGLGAPAGDPLRSPGVFVLRKGAVAAEFRYQNSSQRPDYLGLLDSVDGTND